MLSFRLYQLLGVSAVIYSAFVPVLKPLEAVFGVAILIFSLSLYLLKQKPDRDVRIYGALIGSYFLSLLVADLFATGGVNLLQLIIKNTTLFVGVAFAAYQYERKYEEWSLIAFCSVVVAVAILSVFQFFAMGVVRPPSIMHPVHAGYILADGLLLLLIGSFYMKGWLRASALTGAVVTGVALLLNNTRGGWLSVLFAALVVLLLAFRKHRWRILLVYIAVVSVLIMLPKVQARCHEAYTDVYDYFYKNRIVSSLGLRFEMWRSSFNLFIKHPITGVGPDEWLNQIKLEVDEKRANVAITELNQPHNAFIFVLATTGVVGGGAYLAMLVFPFFLAFKQGLGKNFYADALLGISVAFVVQGFSDSLPVMHRPFQSYLFLTGLLIYGMRQKK